MIHKKDRLLALAIAGADRIVRKEMGLIARAGGHQGTLRLEYGRFAGFVAEAFDISFAAARNYCDQQLAALEDCPNLDAAVFEHFAWEKLVRMGCGDEDPAPVNHLARAAQRLEKATLNRQAINVEVLAPQVTVNVAAPEAPAKQQDKPWPMRTTIKERDEQGRADVIETRPIE